MLIIFDLDDTLIDTSGSVTPFKLESAAKVLLERQVTAQELDELHAINSTSAKTPDALRQFAQNRGLLERLPYAIEELTAPLPDDFRVACTPQAQEILRYYRSRYPVALVTGGYPPFQREKLKKAGFEEAVFSKIAIPEDSVKKPFYQAFAEEFSASPEEVWVCGDRIPMDLAPAHSLGFHTVHMRWGRGKQMNTEPWIDHSITSLAELRNVIR